MKFKEFWKRFLTLDRHHAEGFTLVELIVVIAILAILGGVAVPAYGGYVKKANMTADQQLVSEVAHALELYYYSNPGTEGGYVVLTQNGASGDGVIGDSAMQAVFGDTWADSAALKYDGWKCNISNVTAAIGNSSYITVGTENLLGDVQHCAGSLAEFLRGGYEGVAGAETLDGYLGGTYVSDYLEGYEDSEITADVLANAVVFGIANQLNDRPDEVRQKFANGTYLLNNWNNSNNPQGYDESNRLNHIGGDDATLLADVANTYAALEAFSAYMGIPMELEFDPTNASMQIVADVANECERVMNKAFESDPAKMQAYLGGQSATDADAYISIMKSVNDIKDDYTADLSNTNLFANDNMLDLVNAYVAVSSLGPEALAQLQALGLNSLDSAIVVVLDANSSAVWSIPQFYD